MAFWVSFASGRKSACVVYPWENKEIVEADKGSDGYIDPEKVRARVKRIVYDAVGEEPSEMWGLPYAANPQIGPNRDMAFCYTPEQCKGDSCCRKSRSCCD